MSKKRKVKAKKEKTKMKVKAKKQKLTGKLALVFAGLGALGLAVAGCATQPSRANIQEFNRCWVQVNIGGTNGVPAMNGGDILTQNMANETGGDESNAPSHSVAPDVPVSVPIGMGGGSSLDSLSKLIGIKTSTDVADCAAGDSCSETP